MWSRRPLLVLAELREKGKKKEKKKKKKKKIYDLDAPRTTTSSSAVLSNADWRGLAHHRQASMSPAMSGFPTSPALRDRCPNSQVDGEHSRLPDYLKRQKLTKWKRESLRGTASAEGREDTPHHTKK